MPDFRTDEDEFDTGKIDFFDESDPAVQDILTDDPAFFDELVLPEGVEIPGVVIDANGKPHSKGNGRFVSKRLEYRNLRGDRPDVPEGHVDVFHWPDDPNVTVERLYSGAVYVATSTESTSVKRFRSERLSDGSTRTTYADGTIAVILPGDPQDEKRVLYKGDPGFAERVKLPAVEKEKPAPSAQVIRAWAQRNGYPVNPTGRVPRAIVDAYMQAHK